MPNSGAAGRICEDREQWLALATQWEKLADDMERLHAQLAADDERPDPRERRSA